MSIYFMYVTIHVSSSLLFPPVYDGDNDNLIHLRRNEIAGHKILNVRPGTLNSQ